jgi:hypothetical protein
VNNGIVALLLLAGPGVAHAQRQPGWEVRVADQVPLIQGEQGALAISIAVDRGLVISKDANLIVDLVAEPGVTLRRRRLGHADAVDPEADAPRFAIPLRAEQLGSHRVQVRVRFWVCGGRSCRPVDVRRSAQVVVAAPPAAE